MKRMGQFTEEEAARIAKSFSGDYFHRDQLLFLMGHFSLRRLQDLLLLRRRDVEHDGELLDSVHPGVRDPLRFWLTILGLKGYSRSWSYIFQNRFRGNEPISRANANSIIRAAVRRAGINCQEVVRPMW